MSSLRAQEKTCARWLLLIGPGVLLLAWWILSATGMVRPIFLPAPDAVGRALVSLFRSDGGGLGIAIVATLLRVLGGLAVGVAIGLPLGLVLGYFSRVYAACEIPLDFFRSIPVTALFPFFLLVFGIGDVCKVSIVAWAIALIMTINTIYGVRGCSRVRERYLKTIGASPWQAIIFQVLPEAAPGIISGLRISISQAFIVVIVTEMLFGAEHGIGYLLYSAALLYETDEVLALILVTGILGYAVNKIAEKVGKRIVFWQ